MISSLFFFKKERNTNSNIVVLVNQAKCDRLASCKWKTIENGARGTKTHTLPYSSSS